MFHISLCSLKPGVNTLHLVTEMTIERTPLKLQKQVAFTENNPDSSMRFHPTKVIYENDQHADQVVHKFNNLKQRLMAET